jgi:Fe-S-cluster containining protein
MRAAYRRMDEAWEQAIRGYQQTEGRIVACMPGCSDCCIGEKQVGWAQNLVVLLMSPAQAAILLDALLRLPETEQIAVWQRAKSYADRPVEFRAGDVVLETTIAFRACPLLNTAGQCVAYEARPGACRCFGLPVAYEDRASQMIARYGVASYSCQKNRLAKDRYPSESAQIKLYGKNVAPTRWAREWVRAIREMNKVETDFPFGTVDLAEVLLPLSDG